MSHSENETSSANLQWLEAHAGTTNELLSASRRNLVRSLLRAALQDLEHLERQITETDSMDSLLLKRVDDTSTRISRLRIAIAPHQTLPKEVLAEVFVNCIEEPSVRTPVPVRIPVPASQQIHWRLGHICSRWRDVALSEPRLWNTILFIHNPRNHTSLPPALQEALNRSAQGPLRLRIYCPPDAIGDPDIISDLTAHYAHRCTDIQFSFPENKMKTFLANACTTFEALETAMLVISREHDIDIAHPFLQGARVFESASRLRKLTLHGAWSPNNVALTLEDVNFPWRQLTHIELYTGSVVPSTAHALFIMCPNLQDCCFVSNVHGDGFSMTRYVGINDLRRGRIRSLLNLLCSRSPSHLPYP
ncbi:hypothetical protein Hypma_005177 [Hypsizygus marmoreus]|uniref:Uncharacterized protein n=1 Tax=Hypsizygus marmoreus TaxID=39966 RepID=A0A369J8F8_HYPMA|nr:hypothetical protein Hypma_005177 [Hypsizygus marmoreus]